MDLFFTPEVLFSFLTLSMLEIVLGIDNLIFIAIVVQHLPKQFRKTARFIGLALALLIRIAMLMGVKWVMSLTEPVTHLVVDLSIKDILLIVGGLFLIIKGGMEIKSDLSTKKEEKHIKAAKNLVGAIAQIAFIDFIFSFDSIITAIGITTNIPVIVAAVCVSMVVMLIASGYLADFLEKYPSIKILGIAFIMLIGIVLLTEGFHQHIDRKYVYFALVFSGVVEWVNIIHRKKHAPKGGLPKKLK